MIMTIATTLVCEILSYIIQIIVFDLLIDLLPFVKIILIEILYNSILIILLYPLIEKIGDVLEKIFKEKNILTKYY